MGNRTNYGTGRMTVDNRQKNERSRSGNPYSSHVKAGKHAGTVYNFKRKSRIRKSLTRLPILLEFIHKYIFLNFVSFYNGLNSNDEDDMAKSTKTYEERIRALEKKEQESIEATKKLIAQRKELEKRKKAEESKKRTHRLCQIGGAVESVLGCPIEEEDLPKLIGFLKRQETNGKFFSKAMQKELVTDMEEV